MRRLMPLDIEITGAEDRSKYVKVAVGGFAGAGKTLFASTANDPLFVFFRQNPRIMSIANRAVPHVKLTNHVDENGKLIQSVQDQMLHLMAYLTMAEGSKDIKTIVFDTADELYQALKEQRRIQNNGEFRVGDWGWLQDTYREIVGAFIDLPYHMIANFHLKRTQEDDYTFREFALQGASKDEAPGWFDIVGVLESYDGTKENGERYTQRALLTKSNKNYPFLKDHAFALPDYFELSTDFVGDHGRLLEAVANPELSPKNDRETIERYEGASVEVSGMYTTEDSAPTSVPSPAELIAEKQERVAKVAAEKGAADAATPDPAPEAEQGKPVAEAEALATPTPSESEESAVPLTPDQIDPTTGKPDPPEPSAPRSPVTDGPSGELPASETPPEVQPSPDSSSKDGEDSSISQEEAVANVEAILGAEEVPDVGTDDKKKGVIACTVCGNEDITQDLIDLAAIRFPKEAPLCKEHFKEARAARG